MSIINQPQKLEITSESRISTEDKNNKNEDKNISIEINDEDANVNEEKRKKKLLMEDEYIFGNHISVKHPYTMGELITPLFCNYTPIIAIGLVKGKNYYIKQSFSYFGINISIYYAFYFYYRIQTFIPILKANNKNYCHFGLFYCCIGSFVYFLFQSRNSQKRISYKYFYEVRRIQEIEK